MSLGQTLPVPIACHLGAELTPRRKDLWHAVVQQPAMSVIGFLDSRSPDAVTGRLRAFAKV